jgi:AhpC/TSA antioxidant enzyme
MRIIFALLLTILGSATSLAPLQGVSVTSIRTGRDVDLGSFLSSAPKSMLILGTYAADFNAIEYAQRLRYYLPKLKDECGIQKFGLLLNAQPDAAKALCEAVDLDIVDQVDLFVDPLGNAGRKFGVGRGWLPDNVDINPFIKLFGMLFGLGAWATLPAVIGGYIGNPLTAQPWIGDALAVGMKKGRWPDNALELNDDGSVKINKFDQLPFVGSWKRKPLELATLRLQSMLGVSLQQWEKLAPDEEALNAGVLTQLGGLVVCNDKGEVLFEWKDPGICAVANFEEILKKLGTRTG